MVGVLNAVKSVIAGSYDFDISHTNCRHIVYKDESVWMPETSVIKAPTAYTLEVKDPGGYLRTFSVNVEGPNRISSPDGFDCFPSGKYTFTAKAGLGVGPNSYSKDVFILCKEECRLMAAISHVKPWDEDIEKIRRVQDYLKFAKTSAELGDYTTASEYQKIINSLLDRMECHCECG